MSRLVEKGCFSESLLDDALHVVRGLVETRDVRLHVSSETKQALIDEATRRGLFTVPHDYQEGERLPLKICGIRIIARSADHFFFGVWELRRVNARASRAASISKR